MTKKLAIFGAGGFGREVLQVALDINEASHSPEWNILGFIVEPKYITSREVHGLPVFDSTDWIEANQDVYLIVAIGSSSLRYRTLKELKIKYNNKYATLIHPRAWIGRNVQIGCGSVICAGTSITTDIQIGDHVHVNIGSTIGHDAKLGDFVTLNPGVSVSGNVHLGIGAEIGTGSVIIPHVEIGSWSILGAGSVATKSLPNNVTAVGCPAKVIKERESGWQELL